MRKILVIEDNEMNREILQDILSEEYEVLEAENGAEGLAILESCYQELSVILLDLQMPVMDGFEFLERVSRDPLISAVPVIVMTADENVGTEERCMQLGAVEFLGKPYKPAVMFGRIRNMIRMREAAADIRSLEYDELTGLYTRQAFIHYAVRMLREHPDQGYSLFMADIREFKLINSHFGEAVGNQVLQTIAGQLRKDGREKDGIVSRFEADHFAGLFPVEAVPGLPTIEDTLKDFISIGPVAHIRVKLGIYENVDHSLDMSTICDRAMMAMETIKHSYDRHVATYDGPMAQRRLQEQQMEVAFDDALAAGEFQAWFQPKVDPRDGRIVGAEALVRWKKADGSFNPPYLFIPFFERNGQVVQLDECMFRQVCDLQARWQREGRRLCPISINMSRTTLLHSDTLAVYEQLLAGSGISRDLVPIEITESSAFLSHQITDRMHELKTAGYTLHMDDFGSGYSSLTSLGILPFDVIKLDKSLTDTIGTPRGEMIVRHMLEVIRDLGMTSVVEGVETADQVEILKRLGCDAIQGYYYSKPLPLEEFEALAAKGYIR